MGSQAIFLICVGFSAIQIVFGQVWEFGTDNVPTAVVITKYHGAFSFFQKQQNIKLIVPPCHVVTYVNVQVDNRISSPTVFYNHEKGTVTLNYRLWQYSPCVYTITAKAVWQQGCNIQPQAPGPAPVAQVPGQYTQQSNRFQEGPLEV